MPKDAYYFPHDSNARNDERLIAVRMKHGAAGYGVYFMIVEKLREGADYKCVKDYNIIAFDLRVDASLIKDIVENFGLFAFTDDGECFYSESLIRRMDSYSSMKSKRSAAGKKGMESRWGRSENQDGNNSVITELSKTITGEENKENKENKEREEYPPPAPADFSSNMESIDACAARVIGQGEGFVFLVKNTLQGIRDVSSLDDIRKWIDQFSSELKAKGETLKNPRDFQGHFINWLKITSNGKAIEKTKSGTYVSRG